MHTAGRGEKMKKKKKRRKSTRTKQLKAELLGLLLIFFAIFGSGASAISDGAIPAWLEHTFRFGLGIWYFVASVFLLITGVHLLIKRKYPDFLHRKMIGFYILFSGILLMTHIQVFDRLLPSLEDVSILSTTWDHFMLYVDGRGTAFQTGGGMVGGLLFAVCYRLFSLAGAEIVAVFSILIGLLFITQLSLGDLFNKMGKGLSAITKNAIHSGKLHWEERRKQKEEDQEVLIETHQDKNAEFEEDQHEPQKFPDVAYAFSDNENNDQQPAKKADEPEDDDGEIVDEQIMATAEEENHEYELPSVDLLDKPKQSTQQYEKSQIHTMVKKLEETFKSFGVDAKITKVHVGPAVTKYEISPGPGVKVSKIVSLHDDIALALAAKGLRIEAPIPGKSAVGIEVPNKEIAMVSLREVFDNNWTKQSSKLLFALGKDISGDIIVGELSKMPHLLIAGATGSGKSVCVNGIITTILMRAKPHEVKMMMIDPKKVELSVYNGIPHLLAPVVTDPKKASKALQKVVSEMERRYELFSETGTRNIESYNDYVRQYNLEANEEDRQPQLPYIVVLVDELADLMMVASNDVEDAITRLAQMARAAGIHLIIATQRPSVDVITGVIKANIPSRIAFSVSSQTDSRTILDTGGAEKLLGRGDMLYIPVGSSKPTRVQGAFLSDQEVERIVDHCISQQKASYQEDMIPDEVDETHDEVDDELYDDAVQLVIEMQSASVSMLQRRFRIGYTRAARLIDAMEDREIIGPYEGSKPRKVLVTQMNEEKTS